MRHALIPDACNKQLERDFRRGIYFFIFILVLKYFFWSGSLSEHVLQSVQRPVTDLDIFGWGGVAQALQSLGFRGEAGPFDWMRTRCGEAQLKWLYRMTQTKIKVEAISLIHDTWNRIIVLCGPYDFHFCPRIVCVWPFEVTRLVETDFEETLKIFEIFRRRMNHFASNSVINFVPNQTCECVYVDNGVAAWQCRTFFMRRCRLPATAGRAFSRCHGAAPIGIMISMMKRHGKYGKAWKAVGLHG